VLVTQNQGASWTSQASGTVHDLYSVSCAHATACLAVGNFGIAVVTLDGSHWSPLSTPTFNALRAVVFEDLNHAWVAGFGGTILANSSLTPGCGSASVTPNLLSPEPTGTAIGLTASSTGCSSPTYEFWVQFPNGTWNLEQGWGGSGFSWKTTGLAPGTYTIHVWANQVGESTSIYEAIGELKFVLTGCTAVSLVPPGIVQAVGPTVSLMANATGCPYPEFEYWVQYPDLSWHFGRAWGPAAWNWVTTGLTPGLYTVHVWANETGASLATYETVGADSAALSLCAGASLSPTNPSAPAGSTVVLTTSSTSCVSPRYEFWLQYPDGSWHLVIPYGPSAVFNWNTSGLAPGSYTVHVWVKSLGDPIGTFEVLGSDTVTLTGCTNASVTPPSPTQGAGTTLSLTGAGDPGCPNPQFEYWVQYPDMSWHFGRTWGPAAWNWVTTGLKPGMYTIHAWANQIGASTATYEAIGVANVTLSGCTAASVTPPSGSDKVGTSIGFTVMPTCPTAAIYEFWLQYPDLSWHLEQGFSTTNTWTWHSTGFAKGSYVLHVWVNDKGADTNTYETIGSATHALT